MNGFVLVETTTGNPVHQAVWKPGFGLPGLSDGATGAFSAMSLAALLSSVCMKCADAFGGSDAHSIRSFECDDVRVALREFRNAHLTCVFVVSGDVTMEYARRFANEVGESFIARHADAIEKAAEGKVVSLKKVVRPILATAVWSALQACHDRLLLSLPAHLETNDDGYQWLLTLYSPELTAVIEREDPSDGSGETGLASGDAGPCVTSGIQAGAVNSRDVVKLLITLSQMHRHLSTADASHHFSHAMRSQSIDGTMHTVVRDDFYTVLWVADCHRSGYNKSFTEQALPAAHVSLLRAMLRFVHDRKLLPVSIAPPDLDKENVAN